MICWSCERGIAAGQTGAVAAFCPHCRAVQPADASADHFAVLGLPRRYAIDLAEAEARFKDLSRQLHPDRFAKADPRARRASLQRTVHLNEAWRTLKDPVRRAEYLLELCGYAIGAEEGASAPAGASGASTAGARVRIVAPQALLMEILELREELGEARMSGDDARVRVLAADLRARSQQALDQVAEAFASAESVGWGDSAAASALETAARELVALRYFRRFLDDVAAGDETGVAPATEARHG